MASALFSYSPETHLGYDTLAEQQRQFNTKLGFYKDIFAKQAETAGKTTTGLDALINSYNTAYSEAKAQNEAKYQQQLGIAGQASGQQRSDVLSQYQQQRSNAMQQLARTGMANTTVAPTLQSGIQREQQSALNRVSDQELATKLGIMQNFEYKYPEPGITQTGMQTLADAYRNMYSYPSL
jgi:hypothetical protein